jgi:Flp pilus assembly pilin Flp
MARDERGLSTVEYIIILVLIAVAGIGLWSKFGKAITSKITDSTDAVNTIDVAQGVEN